MQPRRQNYFMHNPSAASIVTNAAFPTERKIITDTGDILIQGQANMTSCAIVCAHPCIPQQYTITFTDANYGDCNSCPLIVGISLSRDRDSDFDLSDDLHLLQNLGIQYPAPAAGGTVTGTQLATWFANYFNNNTDGDVHDSFHISASAAGAVLTLVIPCHLTFQIYPLDASYTPTIVASVAGQQAFLTKEQLKRLFVKDINKIAGQWLDNANFSDCEEVCILSINGCYDACTDINVDRSNQVHMANADTRVRYDIFINSNAPGYAAFITALAAYLTTAATCAALVPTYGSSTPFATGTAAQWAAGVNIDTVGFTYSATAQFQISNGVVTLTVGGTSAANLAANLVADTSTSITSAYAAPNLTVTGFGTNPIVIRQIAL